jgi:Ca2+-binding EF-hand superfamily protein
LSSHEDKLSVFKEIYQNLDPQKKGFLENDDIIKLLEQLRLRKCQYDIGQAKQKLDPMHLGHVTFSSFVEILHHIYSDGTQLSLIQKLGKQCLTLAFG